MTLRPLSSRKGLRQAFLLLSRRLRAGGKRFRKNIGWPSGNANLTVHWQPKHRFWAMLRAGKENHHWCGYGLDDPKGNRSLEFTVQINPPRTLATHRPAGAFLRDEAGHLYLAHSGLLTKGHGSIGKAAFINQHQGDIVHVDWPSGATETLVLIGRIEGRDFLSKLARFIRQVAEFKKTGRSHLGLSKDDLNKVLFTPEFSGRRRSYVLSGKIDSMNTHGYAVESLRDELKANVGRRAVIFRTGLIDLCVFRGGRMTHVFEVKTDAGRDSVYKGIGQLLVHSALERRVPRRILVLPGRPTQETQRRLDALDIVILSYSLRGRTATFENLTKALRASS
jgi:hypothetical protein